MRILLSFVVLGVILAYFQVKATEQEFSELLRVRRHNGGGYGHGGGGGGYGGGGRGHGGGGHFGGHHGGGYGGGHHHGGGYGGGHHG